MMRIWSGTAHSLGVLRHRRGVVLLVTVLAATVVSAVDPPVSLAEQSKRPQTQHEKIIPHTNVPLLGQPLPPSAGDGARQATEWPRAGEANVELPRSAVPGNPRPADPGRQTAAPRRAGDLPIALTGQGQGAGSTGVDQVRVRLASQEIAERAGLTGVLFSLSSNSSLSTSVSVDYSSFRFAGGADFGSRLTLATMPSCVLDTPQIPACQVRTPLASHNNVASQAVSAHVPVSPEPTVLVAAADVSGPQGSFAASSLAPSGSWSVAGNSGAFGWSYPITLPPTATGTAPNVSLAYNSSSVDGRTSDTNNQPSWIGQGWDYTPGFIDRTYRACAIDEGLPPAQQTGDLCWAGQIVTMNLNGQSVALVYDDSKHTWRTSADSGARVELLTGAANGVLKGEHWRVTTTDGMQYWFGRHRGPGYTDQEQTNSAWAVPVYGPRAGNPCYDSAGFAQSSCSQAWRWNLDFVEDPHGNVTAYYYRPETNYYGANKGTAGVKYTRGGTLSRIDYGLRIVNGSMYGPTVPAQVVFGTTERCVPVAGFTCDPAQFTPANAKRWPDTPQDQQCLPGAVCNNHGPSFWSTRRLSTITTQYNSGGGPVTVDSYQLAQSFPSIGDPELRLDSIVRTGRDKAGNSITLPPIEFTSQLLDNRVPGYNNQPAMAHWRITNIATDTGSIVAVKYNVPECALGSMPNDPAHNDKLCFPVYWALPYNRDPILDYFHKYVTTEVQVQDRNAISPTQITKYKYLGTPAWHFDDNEIVKPKHRTYGQFRGYSQVEVRAGDPDNSLYGVRDKTTLVRTTYFRGMDGDPLPGGKSRPASVSNSLGETVPDNNLYQGRGHETLIYQGDGGPLLTSEITRFTTVATTATRNRDGLRPLTADIVNTADVRAVTTLAGGGTRTASTAYRYDALGRKAASTGSGTAVPDVCTTFRYADNTTSWIRDRASETFTSQGTCPADGSVPAPILSATRTYYDNSPDLGAIPGKGDATRTDKRAANSEPPTYTIGATIQYDAAGRPLSTTDALDNTTRIAYTPADGGILAKIVTTNAKNQTSAVEKEPARGLTTATIDVGGRRSDVTYDQLGRVTAVWQVGRIKGQVPPDVTYAYRQRVDQPLAVTTKRFVDYGDGTNEVTSISLYDGLGQLRQTQADDVSSPTGVTGRVVSDTFYDSHGWVVRTNNRYTTDGVPSPTLIQVADSAVDDRTVTSYDGAGRATKATAYRGLDATWDTRTVYGGDRTTTFPPPGGVISTAITDARGKTAELRQYTTPPAVNDNVVSGGVFQATTYQYNALGQLDRMTDPANNVWTYKHDMFGRLATATDPDSGTRTVTYDVLGRIATETDAQSQTLAYEYDELGRKTAEYLGSTSGTKLASWTYDISPLGVGKLSYSTRHTTTGTYMVGVSRYNGLGLPADQTVQIPASEEGFAGTYKTTFSYTTTGLPRTTEPITTGGLPGETLTVDYDRYGNPKSTHGYNSYVSASQYTPYGEPSQYTLGVNNSTAWLTYHRDAQTRRTTGVNLSAQTGWPQIDDLRYTYDPAGNITRIVNTQGQPEAGDPVRTQCFTYDALDRLKEAWTATDNCAATPSTANTGGAKPYWTSWSFDSTGRRQTQVRHDLSGGGKDTTTTYKYPTPGPASVRPHALSATETTGLHGTTNTSYTYDTTGNTKTRTLPDGNQTLTWNQNNRLATVTTPAGTTTYVYDADGNQLLRRDPDKTTLYLPTQEIARHNTTGALTGTRYYTHNGATVALRVGGSNPQYLQSDQHGTNQVSVTATGFAVTRRDFDPYGNPIGTTQGIWPDSHAFLNKPHNPATGLTDVGARQYDPTIGAFISVDPVLDPSNPGLWNPYGYSNNNPVTFSDPTGLFCDSCELYNGHIIGADCPPCGGSAAQQQEEWEIITGKNKDDKKQPTIGKRRLPTFDALKKRPGFAHYMNGGTYEEAISDWAKGVCQHIISGDEEFCTIARNRGLLAPKNMTVHKFMLAALVAVLAAPVVAECAASVICGRAALGALDAIAPEGAAFAGAGATAGGLKAVDAITDAVRGACSFVPGTLVLMADGTYKPIEQIQVGDLVLATDPETGETGPRTVLAPLTSDGTKDLVKLTIDTDGADGDATGTLIVTDNHPFWVPDLHMWLSARELRVGSLLQTSAGTKVQVTATPSWTTHQRVHNLTVDDLHTYYVLAGSAPVLVHNTNCGETTFYHGSDIESLVDVLNNGLDAGRAAQKYTDGPGGFFVATHSSDAEFFATRHGTGGVIKVTISDGAMTQLRDAGANLRPIPRGAKSPIFAGDELHIPATAFDLFNGLKSSGAIRVQP